MIKLKLKPAGTKLNNENKSYTPKEHPEVKEKKVKTPPRKVVYISKRGSKAVFDSIALCAKIFGKDKNTIKYRIEHPKAKTTLDFDWLEGGHLEYVN